MHLLLTGNDTPLVSMQHGGGIDCLKYPVVTSPAGAVAKYVMSVSVCLYVCLSVHEDISRITCAIFTKFFVHVAYARGSVLLRHVDDKPCRLLAGRDDGSAQCRQSVIYNCLVTV